MGLGSGFPQRVADLLEISRHLFPLAANINAFVGLLVIPGKGKLNPGEPGPGDPLSTDLIERRSIGCHHHPKALLDGGVDQLEDLGMEKGLTLSVREYDSLDAVGLQVGQDLAKQAW